MMSNFRKLWEEGIGKLAAENWRGDDAPGKQEALVQDRHSES